MNDAASVFSGKLIACASVVSAQVSPSPVAAGPPLKPRYWTYLVGYVRVAPFTVQVMSFFFANVFVELDPAIPPTIQDFVRVLLSKLVERLPFV